MKKMNSPRLPSAVHVDANMHPNIYKHILDFALVFDVTSLYAFSGHLFEEHNKLPISDFCRLLNPPENSPFMLTSPSDWYKREIRNERLNNKVVGWHDFDDTIVADQVYPLNSIIHPANSQMIRDFAWSTTFRFHETLLESLESQICETNPDNVEPSIRLLWSAYTRAKSAFKDDLQLYQRMHQEMSDKDKAERQFSGLLPVTFCQKIRHTDNYGKLLAEDNPLALIVFEHLTKHAIINEINNSPFNKRAKFRMFIPGKWHDLLLGGINLLSTNNLIQSRLTLTQSEEYITQLMSELFSKTDSFDYDDPKIVQFILDFREKGGPKVLRDVVEKNFSKYNYHSLQGMQAKEMIHNTIKESMKELINFDKSLQLRLEWIQRALIICIGGAGPLVGMAVNSIVDKPAADAAERLVYLFTGKEALVRQKDSFTFKLARKLGESSKDQLLASFSSWLNSGQPSDIHDQ